MLETSSDDKFFGNFEGVLTENDVNIYAAMRGRRKFKYTVQTLALGVPFVYHWGAQFAPTGVVG